MKSTLRRTLRGPVRTRVRLIQAQTTLLAGRRRPGPPDYVGIGVQRCGTSWWQSLIEEHPKVTSLGLGAKELHYFDSLWSRDITQRDIDHYAAQFLRAPGQTIGEWTPRYLFDPWAVPALLRAAPDARLLVLLRDPVARFRSGMRHAHKLSGEISADAVTDAFERGRYAAQLSRVLELVPRSQLLVLQFERCLLERETMLGQTFDFLGLPNAAVPVHGMVHASARSAPIAPSLVDEVRSRYATDVAQLADMFPDEIDPQLWTEANSLYSA